MIFICTDIIRLIPCSETMMRRTPFVTFSGSAFSCDKTCNVSTFIQIKAILCFFMSLFRTFAFSQSRTNTHNFTPSSEPSSSQSSQSSRFRYTVTSFTKSKRARGPSTLCSFLSEFSSICQHQPFKRPLRRTHIILCLHFSPCLYVAPSHRHV
ncbi:hypothetical protein BC827DRAFT_200060 [Russula dissimulans]|nr:hypothetical protein BC827DRAFT_200060 [Russula dissimulans]